MLNGGRDWGELHIVHYNTKYENFSTAMNMSDGLAVLGFFIKVIVVKVGRFLIDIKSKCSSNEVKQPTIYLTLTTCCVTFDV